MIRTLQVALKITFVLLVMLAAPSMQAQSARAKNANRLIIAHNKSTAATIVVSQDAGPWEKQAALDLQKYVEAMSDAKPTIASTPDAINAALQAPNPVLIVGAEALKIDPTLQKALTKVAKRNPFLRADAIALRRSGNRVLLVGTNDESHYFAVSQLFQFWGCRWYLPGELGEVIPSRQTLQIGALEYSYAPPFEIRRALNRRGAGFEEYDRRNFSSSVTVPVSMGSLHRYVNELVPEGGTFYNIPVASDATVKHIVAQVEKKYEAGVPSIPMAFFTEEYSSDLPRDAELRSGIVTKYLGMHSSTDAYLELINKVARKLREKYPQSPSKVGGIALASTFLPPQRAFKPEPNLMMWIVPVNTDPIHAMNDPRSPSRQEWREIVARWSQVMEGRLAVHGYEEAMLVWRNLPNPRQHVFQNDYKEYAKAGILGISPESRGPLTVNFLNIYLRNHLMWNPNADVDALLNEFFIGFYGPAAAPMNAYHRAISDAWKKTIVTEHEHHLAPAIYTPELMSTLRRHFVAAENAVKPLQGKSTLSRNEKLYLERMKMARLGYDVLENYMALVRAAATEGDYQTASELGKRTLASTLALAKFNPAYSMGVNTKLDTIEPGGNAAHLPGEVAQYQKFQQLTDGTQGTLIARLPLEWAFRRDPNDTGLVSGWAYKPVDLSFWNANKKKYTIESRKDYPTTQWEMLRTDLYMQAQGVLHRDWQSYTGHAWYRTEVNLTAQQANEKIRLMFPGIFNEGWLYINGHLVEYRPQKAIWALNDYALEWDADLSGHVKSGVNTISVRLNNSMYMGGIFRRPFVYRPNAVATAATSGMN